MKMLTKTLRTVFATITADLDQAFAQIDSLELGMKVYAKQLVAVRAELKDQKLRNASAEESLAALRKENKSLAHNDTIQRNALVKQSKKLSDLGHGGAEDLGLAENFLEKARTNPIRVGMKLMFTPIRTGIIKEHGRAEPQAWTTQRLFGDLCVSGYRQLQWNQKQLATTKARIVELGVDPETGAINDTSTEIPASKLQFFEERAAWESDVVGYWQDVLTTAKNIFKEQTGNDWTAPDWLTKQREAKPVGKRGVSGKEVVAALKADLKVDVTDLI